jgi:hypothetical protein
MRRKPLQFWLAALGWMALLLPSAAGGQASAKKPGSLEKVMPGVEAATAPGGNRYESGNRPDPFLNPLIQKKAAAESDEELPREGQVPGIAGMNANEVALLGISVSPSGKTAVFRGTDKRVYFLREGDRLIDGYIKTISNDAVLVIRETKLRSGKVSTQEINKRLRNK